MQLLTLTSLLAASAWRVNSPWDAAETLARATLSSTSSNSTGLAATSSHANAAGACLSAHNDSGACNASQTSKLPYDKTRCRDLRKKGKCLEKKAAGLCSKYPWGCDSTCNTCEKAQHMAKSLSIPFMWEVKLAKSKRSGLGSCKDQRPYLKCRQRKLEGHCSGWGCDFTCGKCTTSARNTTKLAQQQPRAFAINSRRSLWWVQHKIRMGGFATVVVPTLCKRVGRLALMVNALRQMHCVGEIMLTTRGLCMRHIRKLQLEEANTSVPCTISSHGCDKWGNRVSSVRDNISHPLANIVVKDMDEWDLIYGPAARFLAASRARTSVLVHMDDDEIPCEAQVCKLAVRALREPIGLYGYPKQGRVCINKGYKVIRYKGMPFNVLLTLFAATSRIFNDAFVRHFSRYAELLVSSKGNGEDLAYNHFLLRYYNRTPTLLRKEECTEWIVNGSDVYEGGYAKLNDAVGMSARANHYRFRKRVCRHLWDRNDWQNVGKFGPNPVDHVVPREPSWF